MAATEQIQILETISILRTELNNLIQSSIANETFFETEEANRIINELEFNLNLLSEL